MPSVKNMKMAIGGAEVTAGTAVTREFVIPLRAVPTLDKNAERSEDPAIIGTNMVAGEYTTAEDISGGIPISPRASGGFGQLLKSNLGTEAAPDQIAACIRIRYTGADASCQLVANTSTDTLTSNTGVKGAESADSNFGTTGVYDLTLIANDTVSKLVALIAADTDYECEKVFGPDASDTGLITTVTRQGSDKWAYFFFTSAASGVYRHEFTPDLTDAERPTYSVQKDGFQTNFLYAGYVADQMSLTAALKSMVEGEVQGLPW